MTRNDNNRRKALGDVVTVDAWHRPFNAGNGVADLHVDVVFSTARVGGEKEAKVSFRLSIRRAELILNASYLEPIKVKKNSVSRETREVRATSTLQKGKKKTASVGGTAGIKLSPSSISGRLDAEASAKSEAFLDEKFKIEEKLSVIIVKQSKTYDGRYRWEFTPGMSENLEGRPWDPIKSPRAKLSDTRSDRSKGIPPTVSIEVRCLREDMIISDIKVKDENIWERLKGRAGQQNRIAAAESYIRDKLVEEGLAFSDIEDRFGLITLVEVIADAEDELT